MDKTLSDFRRINMSIVVCDVDGFLFDFEGHLVYRLHGKYGDVALISREEYDLRKRFADYPEILNDAMTIVNDLNTYRMLNPDLLAFSFLSEIVLTGYEVIFMTSRPKSAIGVTENQIAKYIGAEEFNETLGVQHSLNKTADLWKYRKQIEFIVEDNPYVSDEMKRAGLPVFVWDQPWNQGVFPRFIEHKGRIMLQPSDDEEWIPWDMIKRGEK